MPRPISSRCSRTSWSTQSNAVARSCGRWWVGCICGWLGLGDQHSERSWSFVLQFLVHLEIHRGSPSSPSPLSRIWTSMERGHNRVGLHEFCSSWHDFDWHCTADLWQQSFLLSVYRWCTVVSGHWKRRTRAQPECDIFNLGFIIFHCRPTNYELLRWLVETPHVTLSIIEWRTIHNDQWSTIDDYCPSSVKCRMNDLASYVLSYGQPLDKNCISSSETVAKREWVSSAI